MPDTDKEFYFGGLPENLYTQMVAFLQGKATPGAPGVTASEAAGALTALVSLAKSEHAAAASMVQVRPIDAVFRAIEIQGEFDKVNGAASGAALVAALASLTLKLDSLTNFWLGK